MESHQLLTSLIYASRTKKGLQFSFTWNLFIPNLFYILCIYVFILVHNVVSERLFVFVCKGGTIYL